MKKTVNSNLNQNALNDHNQPLSKAAQDKYNEQQDNQAQSKRKQYSKDRYVDVPADGGSNLHQGLEQLEAIIDYTFLEPRLLLDACTHKSFYVANIHLPHLFGNYGYYENLEFLGDKVLGLVIADRVFKESKKSCDEGVLVLKYNSLVNQTYLCQVATKLQLSQFFRYTQVATERITADILEAILGAIFLDGGLPAATEFIYKHWDIDQVYKKDAKSVFQEWCHSKKMKLPEYHYTHVKEHIASNATRLIEGAGGIGSVEAANMAGSPESLFRATLYLNYQESLEFKGEGSTKKEASLRAATAALDYLSSKGIITELDKPDKQ